MPQDMAQGKQMKILAGMPGANIFKCAMDRIIDHVISRRYPETGSLAISGPILLHQCYEQHHQGVAILYHDTRGARWPYTGMRRGTKLLAYEVPNQARHLENGGEDGDYAGMFEKRQVYSPTCPLHVNATQRYEEALTTTFTFPTASERVRYYMGSWYDPQGIQTMDVCARHQYFDETMDLYGSPKLFNAHNLGSSGTNPFFEDQGL